MSGHVNVGLVGCGFVGQNAHLPAWRTCRKAKVVAVCDTNIEMAKRAAGKFNIRHFYGDFDEMLRHEELDMVDICSSIASHAPLAIDAMKTGCHVLVEKPMASNTGEADEMIAVSRTTGVKLGVVHNMAFLPAALKAKSIVAKGGIGRVIRAEFKLGHPPWDFPAIADPQHWWHRLPGGVFGDSLPHAIYLAKEFLGEIEPLSVYTYKLGSYDHLNPDEIHVVLNGRNGVGTITASCNWSSMWQFDIFGSERNLHVDLNNSYVISYTGKTKMGQGIATLYARENLRRSLQIITGSISTGAKMIRGEHKGHPVLFKKFVESIIEGTDPPVTGEEHREVNRLWEEITARIDECTPITGSTVT